jgi:cellulose biosynthesis protein BcsQ
MEVGMARIYAAVSNKGGAGKTTLVTLLAGEYALRDERVLLIDADGRLNLSGWWRLCHSKDNVPENIPSCSNAISIGKSRMGSGPCRCSH